ncbi:MAG: hypothetical protein ACKVUS_22360 [Saprospiraceae bacterium]
MQKLKFFTLLRTLTEKEVQAFHKQLKQLHGGEEIALRVFEYAKRLHPDFRDGKKLDMAYAYSKIFGADLAENENNRKKMLNALSDLHLWLKDFLLSEKVRLNSLESQVLWLGILQERGLGDDFSKLSARFYTEVSAYLKRDIKGFMRDMVAAYFYYQHLTWAMPLPDVGAIQQCMDTLELCTETIRLKMACEMASLKKVRPSEPTASKASPRSLEPPETHAAKSPPLLLLYREIHQLLMTEEEAHYTRLEAMLAEYADQIDPAELHGILRYMHNYAAMQIRIDKGKEAVFGKKVHQLNKFGLQHDFFTQKGAMSVTEFTNIVNAACSVKDFVWANSFVAEQSRFLPDDIRQDTMLLANAIILFEKKHFKQTLQLLRLTEFRDIHYAIRSRALILRSYVELREDADTILDYCSSFEALLRRNRKPQTGAVEATLEFIRVLKMLLLGKADKQALLERIEQTPNLYFRTWLRAQAEGYEAKYAARKQSK